MNCHPERSAARRAVEGSEASKILRLRASPFAQDDKTIQRKPMPHITLEYSSNIIERPDPARVLRRLHDALAAIESYKMPDIKGRAIRHENFLVSDGERDQCFVHLQLAIMPRPPEIKNQSTAKLLEILKDEFADSLKHKNCSISVEIRDLDKDSYAKTTGGSL
jgi:5-carboxymethyl-2-hydroxymuconate isomerase